MARKFDNLTPKQKVAGLVLALGFALTETDEKQAQRTTDIYTHAAHNYGKLLGLKADDFALIKHITIDELVK